MLEVIATSVDDAIAIERYGGMRIELSSALSEMGITPSYALIKNVVDIVKLPVHVLIRPHSKSFVYSDYDMEVMIEDIVMAKRLGADGIVVGVLDEHNRIDEEKLKKLLSYADDMDVTFHRAIDITEDPVKSVETLLKYPQIKRIVTAGGKGKVKDNLSVIKKMVEAAKGKITIMLGGGLNKDNLQLAMERTGAREVHFGTGVRDNYHYTGEIKEELMKACLLAYKKSTGRN
ncbi:MAG TPA: copper homeostasis protein CutC [Thermoanaerobacterales bacterium]|nr:copper homeostasis protein CutC [Thermoanaerobacterales bacterium]